MPIHEWTRVHPRLYNDFRFEWIANLSNALNSLLPDGYYSLKLPIAASPLVEVSPRADFDSSPFVVVCREPDDAVAAVIAVARAVEPGERPPRAPSIPPVGRVVVSAHPSAVMAATSYEPGLALRVFSALLSVGDPIPHMPLFIEPERHVMVPLEETYQGEWNLFPVRWRAVIEGTEPAGPKG